MSAIRKLTNVKTIVDGIYESIKKGKFNQELGKQRKASKDYIKGVKEVAILVLDLIDD